jgi:hypothetical protein
MTRNSARVTNFMEGNIMPEEDCNNCRKYDFGKGFEHVRDIAINGVLIVNSGYTYDIQSELIKIPTLEILSAN